MERILSLLDWKYFFAELVGVRTEPVITPRCTEGNVYPIGQMASEVLLPRDISTNPSFCNAEPGFSHKGKYPDMKYQTLGPLQQTVGLR